MNSACFGAQSVNCGRSGIHFVRTEAIELVNRGVGQSVNRLFDDRLKARFVAILLDASVNLICYGT